MKYHTIVADPPWRYASAATKADAAKHYATMATDDICRLDLPSIEDDAHLWLWGTNALMEDAYQVVRAWGFSPLTIITWCKKQPGVGHYLRNNTEHTILASRGRPMVPDKKPLSTWYVWPRGEHSRKPDAFYDLVEQVSPGPYLEMFARRNRLGWDTFGLECLPHVVIESGNEDVQQMPSDSAGNGRVLRPEQVLQERTCRDVPRVSSGVHAQLEGGES